ncbi:hypothetical protein BCR44DRAFT_1231227 [Catenaria anguillulae PL171]|uniref:Muts domain V-domain-containing protein n=1 Tax=Catenaria anguillulae PL171 TaxID=765915 RepID=A0A1Y2HDM0_9FUNG|nr:hypothetical protein BCR44DRAFT_1231227 [Catenaria anguillulae PL171]
MADNTKSRSPSSLARRRPGTFGSSGSGCSSSQAPSVFSHVTASVVSVLPSPSWAMPPVSFESLSQQQLESFADNEEDDDGGTNTSEQDHVLATYFDQASTVAAGASPYHHSRSRSQTPAHHSHADAPLVPSQLSMPAMPPPRILPSRNGRRASLPPQPAVSSAVPSLPRSRPSTSARSTISSASLGILAPTLAGSLFQTPKQPTSSSTSRKRTADRAGLCSSPAPPSRSGTSSHGLGRPRTLLASQFDPNHADEHSGSMSTPRPPTTRGSNRPATRARSVVTTTAAGGEDGGVSQPEHRFLVALFSPKGVTGVSGGGESHGGGGGGNNISGQSGEIGVCVFDLVTTTCLVSQFIDSKSLVRTLNKLNVYPPSHLIVPSTFYKPEKSEIALLLESNLDGAVDIIPISRKHFSTINGLEFIRRYALEDQVQHLETSLGPRALGLAAVAAMLKFIETDRHITFTRSGVYFLHESVSGTMFIDTITARNLELVRNQTGLHSQTLLGVLNKCQTVMGARLLRSTILQPPVVPETIELRLDAVAELGSIPSSVQSLLSSLSQIPNIDKLISGFIHIHPKSTTVKSSELDLALILDLRTALRTFPSLLTSLSPFTNPLLTQAQAILSDPTLDTMLAAINELFAADLSLTSTPMGQRNARAFSIQAGVHGLLDVSRRTYQETVADIMQLVDDYAARYEMPLRAVFQSASNGFVLECKADQVPEEMLREGGWPDVFVNVAWKRKVVTCNTLEVMKLNERVRESMNEIFLISDRIVVDLKEELRSKIGVLYKVSESIALVDLLCSFTRLSLSGTYVRPMLSQGMTVIAQGRHPILSVLANRPSTASKHGAVNCADRATQPYVPNDTYLDSGCNVQIVTGANGSGKTSYLKQVALITVMAHMGCPVPAQEAVVCVTEVMLSRMSFDDCMLSGASSYMLEMREVAHVLREVAEVSWIEKPKGECNGDEAQGSVMGVSNEQEQNDMLPVKRKALVLMDEIGRGTSPTEAAGIAYAIIEALAHTKAFVLFATHFHHLFPYLEPYPNIVHLHLSMHVSTPASAASNSATTLTYEYRVQDGVSPTTRGYGIQLAASLGLPASILATAERVADRVATMHGFGRPAGEPSPEYAFARAVHECARRVVAIKYNPHLDDEDRERCLSELQAELRASFPVLGERSVTGSQFGSRVGGASRAELEARDDNHSEREVDMFSEQDIDMYSDYEVPMSPYPGSSSATHGVSGRNATPTRRWTDTAGPSSSQSTVLGTSQPQLPHAMSSPVSSRPCSSPSAPRRPVSLGPGSSLAQYGFGAAAQESSAPVIMRLTDSIGKYDPVSGTFLPPRPSQVGGVADSVVSLASVDVTDPIED